MIYLVTSMHYWEYIPSENRTLCGRIKRVAEECWKQGTVCHENKAGAIDKARQLKACVIRETQRGEYWDYELLINFEKPNG